MQNERHSFWIRIILHTQHNNCKTRMWVNAQRDVRPAEYTPYLKKRPTFGMLWLWCTWMDFDIFWQKCYR